MSPTLSLATVIILLEYCTRWLLYPQRAAIGLGRNVKELRLLWASISRLTHFLCFYFFIATRLIAPLPLADSPQQVVRSGTVFVLRF